MFLESQGGGPIEMYQLIGVRDHKDLANKLMDHILTRLPEASVLWEKLSEDIASEISYHLFINELCGLTDLCQKATPRNLAEELVRDPGPDEVPANT
jgi:hypothetical protein